MYLQSNLYWTLSKTVKKGRCHMNFLRNNRVCVYTTSWVGSDPLLRKAPYACPQPAMKIRSEDSSQQSWGCPSQSTLVQGQGMRLRWLSHLLCKLVGLDTSGQGTFSQQCSLTWSEAIEKHPLWLAALTPCWLQWNSWQCGSYFASRIQGIKQQFSYNCPRSRLDPLLFIRKTEQTRSGFQ